MISSIAVIFVGAMSVGLFAQDRYQAQISGRIVDEKGQPRAGVDVTFANSEELRSKGCWVRHDAVFTDAAGRFKHEEYCTVPERSALLFIAPSKGWELYQTPIYPSFWPELRESDARFAGVPVRLQGNQQIDLGDIVLPVDFAPIELFVLDEHGKHYFQSENDWSRFHLVVRDSRGIAVGSESLPISDISTSVSMDRGSVKVALPIGTWTLEILGDLSDLDQNGITQRSLACRTVSIERSRLEQKVSLTVRRQGKE